GVGQLPGRDVDVPPLGEHRQDGVELAGQGRVAMVDAVLELTDLALDTVGLGRAAQPGAQVRVGLDRMQTGPRSRATVPVTMEGPELRGAHPTPDLDPVVPPVR